MTDAAPAFVLPDLCDEHADIVRVAEPLFRSFGGRPAFGGPIRTIKCFEDNSLVAERVRERGDGALLELTARHDRAGTVRASAMLD